ncbi:MAG: 2-oxo acid dehydrogenase subunit E2 [Gaiellaceae bacterium]
MNTIDSWRKLAAVSWNRPVDPQIYGDIEVDAEALLGFIEQERKKTGSHVTVTHVVGKALAHALAENPDVNVRLSRGHFTRRDSVDLFFVVAISDGRELSGAKIVDADRKSAAEIAEELNSRARSLRAGDDADLGRSRRMLGRAPPSLLRLGLRLATWLADRGVSPRALGLPRDAFGSAIVSSVSAFGAEHAYGPLNPWYRVPVLVLVSEVRDKPAVVDGEVCARPLLTVTATLDHRYLDGAHAGRLVRSARAYLENPASFEAVSSDDAMAQRGA